MAQLECASPWKHPVDVLPDILQEVCTSREGTREHGVVACGAASEMVSALSFLRGLEEFLFRALRQSCRQRDCLQPLRGHPGKFVLTWPQRVSVLAPCISRVASEFV